MKEAIEAKAKELAACYGVDWDEAGDYERGRWTDTVSRLIAGTWDEGASAGEENVWSGEHTNPYRSHA